MIVDTLLIFTILGVTSLLFLSVMIVLSRANKYQKECFVLFSISVSLFLSALYVSNIDFGYSINLLSNRGVFVLAPIMVLSIDRVIVSILDTRKRSSKFKEIWLPITLSLYAMTPLFIETIVIKLYDGVPYPSLVVNDLFYWSFIVLMVYPIFPVLYKLYKATVNFVGFDKQRALTLLVSTGLVFVLLIISNVVIPSLGINSTSSLAPIWMFLWAFSIYYSIANQKLFGIKHILSKLIGFVVDGIVFLIIFILFYLLVRVFLEPFTLGDLILLLPLFVIMISLYQLYKPFSLKYINKYLKIRDEADEIEINNYSLQTSRLVVIEDIFQATSQVLKNVLQSEKIALFVFSDDLDTDSYFYSSSKFLKKDDAFGLFKTIRRNFSRFTDIYMFSDDFEKKRKSKINNNFHSRLKNLGVEIIVRILDGNKTIGLLTLGYREDGTQFSQEELTKLLKIVSNLSLSVTRSLLFNDLKDFNSTLQSKIDRATENLKEKNVALKQVRDRERDMMDIIGHELRTPLTIIKTTLGLVKLKETNEGNVSKKDLNNYIERMDSALKREVRLLETMLSSTKIDAGRMQLQYEKVDILPFIEDSILANLEKIKEKSLKIIKEYDVDVANVFGDKSRLPEIIENILGNAIKYTEKGSVTIKVSKEDDYINFVVSDTGVGIPSHALKMLGTKFYRVQQYVNDKTNTTHIVRPGGTGLGLYVTFGLIKLLGGSVNVNSTVGKGSTFKIMLPRYTGQKKIVNNQISSKNVFNQLGLHK